MGVLAMFSCGSIHFLALNEKKILLYSGNVTINETLIETLNKRPHEEGLYLYDFSFLI